MAASNDLLKLDIAALAEGAWRWWIDELRGLWEGSYLHRLSRDADLPVVVLADDGSLKDPAGKIGDGMRRFLIALRIHRLPGFYRLFGRGALTRPVALKISPTHYMRTRIDLPTVAARVLPTLLKFEIERHTPLALADTVFGYRIIGRDRLTNRMSVDLVVAKLRVVNRAGETAQDRGYRIARVSAALAEGGSVAMPVFGGLAPAISLNSDRRITAGLAIAVLLLAGACGWAYSDRQSRHAAVLDDVLDTTERQAVVIESLSRKQAALVHDLHDLEKQRKTHSETAILEALAQTLPDDSWLTSVAIEGDGITMTGFSGEAFQLPAVFNASGQFVKAHLLGPVQRQSTDPADRFDLAVEYMPPGSTGAP